MSMQRRIFVISSFICLGMCGCAEDWKAKTFPVSGTITVNGLAPEGAVIQLMPVGRSPDSRGSQPFAIVPKDGIFKLRTYAYDKGADGCPKGTYVLTIRWQLNPGSAGSPDRLKDTFRFPEKPYATIEIKGPTVLEPIVISNFKLYEGKSDSKQEG